MININLLPWREAKQKQTNRKLIVGISTQIIATILLCVLIYFFTFYRAAASGPDRNLLNQAIAKTDAQITKLSQHKKKIEALNNQKTVLIKLYDNKFQTLMILQAIDKSLPKTINLDRIVKKDDEVVLYGTAPSNKQVTELIDNLTTNGTLSNPVLKESKTVSANDVVQIKFQVNSSVDPKYRGLRVTEDEKSKNKNRAKK